MLFTWMFEYPHLDNDFNEILNPPRKTIAMVLFVVFVCVVYWPYTTAVVLRGRAVNIGCYSMLDCDKRTQEENERKQTERKVCEYCIMADTIKSVIVVLPTSMPNLIAKAIIDD